MVSKKNNKLQTKRRKISDRPLEGKKEDKIPSIGPGEGATVRSPPPYPRHDNEGTDKEINKK